MPTFILNPPAGITETDAGRVERFLENRGYVVDSVTVLQTKDGILTYVVECDRDPGSVVESYTRTPDLTEQARTILSELKPKLIDGTATTVEMRRALAALVVLQNI